MIEIENAFGKDKIDNEVSVSLFVKLEAIVGNYFLSEVTNGVFDGLWNSVYFDPAINCETEIIECIPENLIGYVDKNERWAFILDRIN